MTQITTWPGWECIRQIGAGSFGKVYEIQKEENGKIYKSALKVISIPQNAQDLENILDESMDEIAATQYFKSFVDAVTNEFVLMASLQGEKNIVSYEDHMVIEREGEIGWDILIKMELLTPLMKWCAEHPLDEADVIRLGKDMSKAMELCHGKRIIHRDIKPQNIFVDNDGNFKLGDFGIARVVEKTSSVMSQKGTYTYMAPEVFKGQYYNETADIYSLGVVLYRFLNQNRTPFLPLGTLNFTDHQIAQDKRMSGEVVPPPVSGSAELKEIVLKTLEYDSEKRVQTAKELNALLKKCNESSFVSSSCKVEEVIEEDFTKGVSVESPKVNEKLAVEDEELTKAVRVEKQKAAENIKQENNKTERFEPEEDVTVVNPSVVTKKEEPKKKKSLFLAVVVGILIVVGVAIGVTNMNSSTTNNDAIVSTQMTSQYALYNPNWMLKDDSSFVIIKNNDDGHVYTKQESYALISKITSSETAVVEICENASNFELIACDTGITEITIKLTNGDTISQMIQVFREKGSDEVKLVGPEKIVLSKDEPVTVIVDAEVVDSFSVEESSVGCRFMMDGSLDKYFTLENFGSLENGFQFDLVYSGDIEFKDLLTVYIYSVDDENYLNIYGATWIPIAYGE